ncbi:MAG: peptidase M15 [Bacteroidales bacterium]|nr:peptidase M15 [Bacteroidales bacterium]
MKHFTISELLKSNTALKHKLWNGAPKEAEENLRALVNEVLDPLREAYGKPIRVNSGYRCPRLNNLVGGSPNSQHMRGEAADIQPVDGNEADLEVLAQFLIASGKFDQLILYPTFIHVSYRRLGWNRKQILQK